MIIDFVKQESNLLRESLVGDTREDDGKIVLDDQILTSINESLDDNNKLLKVLTFNPTEIPPKLYLQFLYNGTIQMNEDTKNLLIKRLAFHQQFDHIWKILVNETSTINDIEIIVEIIGGVLEECDNKLVGVLDAVTSSESIISNQSLRAVIVESFSHTFSIPRTHINEALILHRGVLSFVDMNPPSNELSFLVVIQKIMEQSSNIQSDLQILSKLYQCPRMPGWFNFACRNVDPKMVRGFDLPKLFRVMRGVGINDYDFMSIIRGDAISLEEAYKVYKKEYVINNDRLSWSLTSMVERVIKSGDVVLLKSIVSENHHVIGNKALGECLVELQKRDFDDCDQILSLLTSTVGTRSYSSAFSIFFSEKQSSWRSSVSMHRALLATHNLPTFSSNLRRHFVFPINHENAVTDVYADFVKESKRSTKILLEILRSFLVRNGMVVESIVVPIFCSVVSKTTSVNHKGMRVVDERYKKKFHNSIRALSQLLSDMSSPQGVLALKLMNNSILGSEEFSSVDDQFRRYLQKQLVSETCAFFYRKNRDTDFVKLIQSLELPSRLGDYIIQLYNVKRDPQSCFETIQRYKDNKSGLNRDKINGIESGILTCESLGVSRRLKLFKMFRESLQSHGFKSKISTQNLTTIFEMILDSQQHSEKSIDRLLSFASNKKVPRRKVNSWVTTNKKSKRRDDT